MNGLWIKVTGKIPQADAPRAWTTADGKPKTSLAIIVPNAHPDMPVGALSATLDGDVTRDLKAGDQVEVMLELGKYSVKHVQPIKVGPPK